MSCSQNEILGKSLLPRVQLYALPAAGALDLITLPRVTAILLQHIYAFISGPKFLITDIKIAVNCDQMCKIAEVSSSADCDLTLC